MLASSLLALMLVPTPALAECVNQSNFFPPFSTVAPTAQRIIVGTVGTDLHGHDPSPWFDLHVDEVVLGRSPSAVEIRGLYSGLPLTGAPACRDDAVVYAEAGDVIAIAYDGRVPGVNQRVTSVAWISGTPHSLLMQRVETLTLREVRRLATLPRTDVAAAAARSPELLGALFGLAFFTFACGGLPRTRRARRPS